MLQHLTFSGSKGPFKLALLIKNSGFNESNLYHNYIKHLKGVAPEEVVVLSLEYTQEGKAPVSLIKEHLSTVGRVLEQQSIQHVLCADAPYFKPLCKVKKAEPNLGYVLPTIWPGVQAAFTLNHNVLFKNPSLKSKLLLGVKAISNEILGETPMFQDTIIHSANYVITPDKTLEALKEAFTKPTLTLDLETDGLHLNHSNIVSAGLAWNQHNGTAIFDPTSSENKPIFKDFLENYKGKFIYHNATFDIKVLIAQVFMESWGDVAGMHRGLEILFRDMEDTKILSYLATNSTSGNQLGLKHQAFEFAGNYALEDIANLKNATVEEILEYNLIDCLSTWYVFEKHRETVRQEQEKVYQEIFKPALKVLVQTELEGMPINNRQVQHLRYQLQSTQEAHYNYFNQNPIIKTFLAELRLEEAISATAKLKTKVKTADDFAGLEFNPRSNKQVRKLLYESLQLPIFRYTDTKLPSTDGKSIEGLMAYLKKTYAL